MPHKGTTDNLAPQASHDCTKVRRTKVVLLVPAILLHKERTTSPGPTQRTFNHQKTAGRGGNADVGEIHGEIYSHVGTYTPNMEYMLYVGEYPTAYAIATAVSSLCACNRQTETHTQLLLMFVPHRIQEVQKKAQPCLRNPAFHSCCCRRWQMLTNTNLNPTPVTAIGISGLVGNPLNFLQIHSPPPPPLSLGFSITRHQS